MTPEDFFKQYSDQICFADCWLWLGTTAPNGYGNVSVDGEKKMVHRVVMGDLERGQVNHHCDTKNCVNPQHLYIGTQSQNIQDALNRGQITKESLVERLPDTTAESNPSSKLSEETVVEIRSNYPELTYEQLAERYSVSVTQVGRIIRGESWDYPTAYPE